MTPERVATYVMTTLQSSPRIVLNEDFWKITNTSPTETFIDQLQQCLNDTLYKVSLTTVDDVPTVLIVRMFSCKD